MKVIALIFCSVLGMLALTGYAAEPAVLKVGAQATGTLTWELALMQHDDRLKNAGYRIEVVELANAEAGKIALQSGSVDMIVSDWVWVSRMRADGADFTFYPYSTASGALLVPAASTIKSVKDLAGKRLGIAGGELDKNWLLLQALGKQDNIDLNAAVDKVFAAPPLIDAQLKQGRLEAALNYWHFAVTAEAQGYRQMLDGPGILKALGITEAVPMLGYVFKQNWAEQNKAVLKAFLATGAEAKNRLCTDTTAWASITPLLHSDDKAIQQMLRQRYCEGKVNQWDAALQQAAERIYAVLKKVSDNQLTGKSEQLQPGTFWQAN